MDTHTDVKDDAYRRGWQAILAEISDERDLDHAMWAACRHLYRLQRQPDGREPASYYWGVVDACKALGARPRRPGR